MPPGKLPAPRVPGSALFARAALYGPAAARLLQVLEEIGARVEHHDIVLVLERRLVRLQAAIKRVELGILSIRAGVDRRSFGVAFALGFLRLLVGVGEYDLALAIGIGADFFRLGAAQRAKLVRDA